MKNMHIRIRPSASIYLFIPYNSYKLPNPFCESFAFTFQRSFVICQTLVVMFESPGIVSIIIGNHWCKRQLSVFVFLHAWANHVFPYHTDIPKGLCVDHSGAANSE